ncbi:MAG TPA: SPOR domain-containing protein [Candidatus Binataceae bacterium]|nr:SPOR domain-containing protein [Candidatus Binataceae bacterium]
MRFEIRAGGAFLILVGLVGLSGAVFALGLIAGYEMARQNTADTSQIASVFPVPSPPALEPTPAAATPGAQSSPASAPSVAALAPAKASRSIAPEAMKTPAERAPASPPPRPIAAASPPMIANAAPAAGLRKHPYNIQIDAVMDRAGADDMVRRLKGLGFPSSEIATTMNGQTWYRVSVGPYATEDEAKAAQEKLHQQYRATYSGN